MKTQIVQDSTGKHIKVIEGFDGRDVPYKQSEDTDMTKQHTPTPYKFVKTNAGIRYIVACDDNIIATISSQADGIDNNAKDAEADATAKLFVTACNSHDRLEEVNRELVKSVNGLLRLLEQARFELDFKPSQGGTEFPSVLNARAALAKAEKQA